MKIRILKEFDELNRILKFNFDRTFSQLDDNQLVNIEISQIKPFVLFIVAGFLYFFSNGIVEEITYRFSSFYSLAYVSSRDF